MVLAAMAATTLACVLAQASPAGQAYLHERTEAGIAQPLDVAFDAEGRLIVAAGRQGLLRMEADGTRTVLAPGSVDRVPNTSRVEADPRSHAVQVKETSGVRTVDGATWAIGRLLAPEAAAIAPDGSLWIADTGHARVVRVAPDGSAAAFGERGFFPGQFVAPSGVAFDAGGPLVTDRLNHRVTRLAWDGSLRDVFGLHAFQPRQGEGRVHYPQAVAVDAGSGRVAVAEPFERRVQLFRPATDVERARPMPPMPSKEGVSSHFGRTCRWAGTPSRHGSPKADVWWCGTRAAIRRRTSPPSAEAANARVCSSRRFRCWWNLTATRCGCLTEWVTGWSVGPWSVTGKDRCSSTRSWPAWTWRPR